MMIKLSQWLMCSLVFLVLITSNDANKKKICRDPDPVEASFYMIQEFRTDNMGIRKDKQTRMYGERSCKKALRQATNGTNQFQLCPSFYLLNFDPNRDPPVVAEAHCACAVCGGNQTGKCQPMYYYRQVLEFDKTRGCYRKLVREFQNGCVCMVAGKLKPDKPVSPI